MQESRRKSFYSALKNMKNARPKLATRS